MSERSDQSQIRVTSRNAVQRYECKYGVTEQQAAQLKHYFAPHLALDPFAKSKGGSYRIVSLYLDSPDLILHRSALEGERDRYKLRIRVYADDPKRPIFLETKHRVNSLISKTRVKVCNETVAKLIDSPVPGREMSEQDRAAFDDFVHRVRILDAKPMALVRYNREAFAGLDDRTARVTFDRRIMSSATNRMAVRCDGTGWNSVPNHRTLLELKFTGRCPTWMSEAIDRLELQRVSFSKYAQAMITEARNGAHISR